MSFLFVSIAFDPKPTTYWLPIETSRSYPGNPGILWEILGTELLF